MNNWNIYTKEERIIEWRKFRLTLAELDTHQKMEKTAEYFMSVPIASRFIDYYSPETWPSPWEILNLGWSCTSSISLLIAHTLKLTDVECEIYLVDSPIGTFLLPVVDNKYILNYELGKVVDIDTANDVKIKQIHKI
jgi:hypothetical protein